MANSNILLHNNRLLATFVVLLLLSSHVVSIHKHYIVYLGSHNGGLRLQDDPEDITKSHHEMIANVSKRNNNPSKKLIYSYTKAFNGFAAVLEEEEAQELAKHPKIISIFESGHVEKLTTRSWDFLSTYQHQNIPLSESIWEKANYGEDIIIANLDTGVWPESESFSDKGFGPIPKRFKGQCDNENDPTFICNRKLIGARFFYKGLEEVFGLLNKSFPNNYKPSARDMGGHGTLTLSIAGGNNFNVVTNKSNGTYYLSRMGMSNMTIKGGAPKSRVVAYKVGWPETKLDVTTPLCSAMDILAALEAAINDGVDILNLSLGTLINVNNEHHVSSKDNFYIEDTLSIGSYHAMANGILPVAAAGNSGPTPSLMNTPAPWVLMVGASSMDRQFVCHVYLGNKQIIKATRFMDQPRGNNNTYYPLVFAGDARRNSSDLTNASYCMPESIDPLKVKGKIIVCLLEAGESQTTSDYKKVAIMKTEAMGVIIANDQETGSRYLPQVIQLVPTAHVNYKDGQTILSYINSSISTTTTPTALLTKTTPELGYKPAPVIPNFSSRGPNPITPHILKPDVIAPGANIIGSFSPRSKVYPNASFMSESGTSFAAPHVSGIAALLKKLYPNWSTSAIKSAIMTTAIPIDNDGKPILEDDMVSEATPFAYGAGLVQPNLALDPGLVYDMNHYDYLNFLCAHHINSSAIRTFAEQHNYNCPSSFSLMDFNYPSITIPDFTGNAVATRKLKNVGTPNTYTARIQAPLGVSISVEPKTLVFSKIDQEIMFKLVFSADHVSHLPMDYSFGSLVWSDGKHIVRSPITIKPKKLTTSTSTTSAGNKKSSTKATTPTP